MLPTYVFNFICENVRTGVLRDMFTQNIDEDEDKLSIGLYDVMAMYIQVYNIL